ncbi:MAG: hypothetical protein Q9162_005985 [Coniocarpon cinnabarinum]
MRFVQIPSLRNVLHPNPQPVSFVYDKKFCDAVNDPVLILHSSGSTGELVQMTNGSFSVVDQGRNVPVPAGRRAQNAGLFDFGALGGKFYAPFPPYYLAGIHAHISIPIFSAQASLVAGPNDIPPSGTLLSEIMEHHSLRAIYSPPSIIEQWFTEQRSSEKARMLDFVIFGGGPLASRVGQELEKVTQVCQTYGSIEIGGVQLLVPNPGEWSYLEFNPFEECDMQDNGDGTYELVLHQTPELAWRRTLAHNLPSLATWRTGDLFVRHATNPNLWQFASRIDDELVMASGFKLKPVQMETLVQGSPLVSGALVVGQGKSQPALLVEPSVQARELMNEEIKDGIWKFVESANENVAAPGKVMRSKIIVAQPRKPFHRAPKGTIIRKLTTQAYAHEIDEVFFSKMSLPDASDASWRNLPSAEELSKLIQSELGSDIAAKKPQKPPLDLDFFSQGLDSLNLAELAHAIRKKLSPYLGTKVKNVSTRLLYRFPTIQDLAEELARLLHTDERPETYSAHDTTMTTRALEDFTRDLPAPRLVRDPIPSSGVQVLLLGPRGFLGPNIVHSCLQTSRISTIHCLNRFKDGRARLEKAFKDQGLDSHLPDERLKFYDIDLNHHHLGLSHATWEHLRKTVSVVIHNAWKVDFGLPLSAFLPGFVRSVRDLVDLCAESDHSAKLIFCSSISTVQDWAKQNPGLPVPEHIPVDASDNGSYAYREVVSSVGYIQAKQVAERMLAQAAISTNIPVSVLRLGQLAPSIPTSKHGQSFWPDSDSIPAITKISQAVQMMPIGFSDIQWIPVDVMGHAIRDLSLSEGDKGAEGKITTYNVVHPRPTPSSVLHEAFTELPGNASVRAVSLDEWVTQLEKMEESHIAISSEQPLQKDPIIPLISRFLPWFQHLRDILSDGKLLPRLEVQRMLRDSATMRNVEPIERAVLKTWCCQWLEK